MQVELVSMTQSLLPGERQLTAEELIVYTARVSNPGNQNNHETADKLLAFLIKNKHWSPFEMVDLTVGITTSRAIAQQILRHRSFSFQEFSQRYAAVTELEPVQNRRQADENRQSSTEEFDPMLKVTTGEIQNSIPASEAIALALAANQSLYNTLLESGVAKESARMVLPLTTKTKICMKGSVRSWVHYLQIRADKHTQLEHQEIAVLIQRLFLDLFPNLSLALGWVNTENLPPEILAPGA